MSNARKGSFLLRELIFPPKCIACRQILEITRGSEQDRGYGVLCRDCLVKFEAEKLKKCRFCKAPINECTCMPALLSSADCHSLLRVCGYNGYFLNPVTRIVFTLKQKALSGCEELAATELASRLKSYLKEYEDCDFCITYIPRRRRSIIHYGHDHGERLAKRTAELCGLEFHKFIQNETGRKEQKTLQMEGRLQNARLSLSPTAQIKDAADKNIILIDDIVTTGSSLSVGTSILFEAGAASVTCLCFASTEKRQVTR